ncbi:hypothetical protein [Streptomyces sp. bgisy032]
MNRTGIPDDVHPVWPAPDLEPVDTAVLTRTVRAAWITDDLIEEDQ